MSLTLWRPAGLAELRQVAASGWRAWPPRRPEEPLFYPVLSQDYATRIARDWNSRQPAPNDLGFVLRCAIPDRLARCYPERLAGGHDHVELWVPAEDLDEFNAGLEGPIELVAGFRDGVALTEAELAPLRSAP